MSLSQMRFALLQMVNIILSRELAAKNHFPAIDILESLSRLMKKIVSKEHQVVSGYLKNLMATYKENEELLHAGAYVRGSNKTLDKAIYVYSDMMSFLKQEQGISTPLSREEVYATMVEIAKKAESLEENDDEGV